jgi:hypothetical protein
VDRDVVETGHKVNDGENRLADQAPVELLYVRQGVAVVYGNVVEALEVAAGPPATAGLWGNVKRRSPGRVGPADDAKMLHLCELCFRDGQLLTVKAPCACV